MKLQANFYGTCVTLETKICTQTLGNKIRKPKSNFDESKTFITGRYENLEDVKSFLSQPIFADLFRKCYLKVRLKDKQTILVKYFGDTYQYNFTTGVMYINNDGRFFAESVRSFFWDYVLRGDAQTIKSSFATKNMMINQIAMS
jgi:hypothetical protein